MPPLLLHLPPPSPSPSPLASTHSLNSTPWVRALTLAAAQPDTNLTAALHALTIKSLLHFNPLVANSLLHAYARCGRPDLASNLFDQMPHRDVVSWTSLISAHCRNAASLSALAVFSNMLTDASAPAPNEFTLAAVLQASAQQKDARLARALHGCIVATGFIRDAFVYNSMLDNYSKCGLISDAEELLYRMECRDVVSWSVVISGCVLNGILDSALKLFVSMLEDGVDPNVSTMLSVIQACSLMRDSSFFGWVHAWVFKLGLDSDPFVSDSLVEMYCKNGFVHQGMNVFLNCSEPSDPDVMASIVQGCTLSASLDWGRAVHGFLIKLGFSCFTIVDNSLMGMYGKHEQPETARAIFERMEIRDIVSWNTMISCLVKNQCATRALQYLTEIHCSGEPAPDVVTVVSSLQACSEIALLQDGQILHGYAIRSGVDRDVFVCNALIDMYSKGGRIDLGEQVFEEMGLKDISSWNSMIAAYGIHGDGNSALKVFRELKEAARQKPNSMTFNSLISACGHSGLWMEGCECFENMRRDYGIEPIMEHYASMVDLLGRCGRVAEAWDFIEEMPIEPGPDVWGSLLGACGIHGDVGIAERAAEKLSVLEPDETVWRVALANVYAKAGRWKDCGEVRAEMKRRGERKEVGWSSVELNGGERFRFMAGDTRHSETNSIYGVWNAIKQHMVDAFI